MSNIRIIAGITVFCIGAFAASAASKFITMMIGEINRQRKEDNQISYFGDTPSKMLGIFSEYRRLYPKGRLRHYAIASIMTMTVALLVTAVCFNIIG